MSDVPIFCTECKAEKRIEIEQGETRRFDCDSCGKKHTVKLVVTVTPEFKEMK